MACIYTLGDLDLQRSFLDFTSGTIFPTWWLWTGHSAYRSLVAWFSGNCLLDWIFYMGSAFDSQLYVLEQWIIFCLLFAFYISCCYMKFVKFSTNTSFRKYDISWFFQTSIWCYNLILSENQRDGDRVFWTIFFMDSLLVTSKWFVNIRTSVLFLVFSKKGKSARLDEINVDWRHDGMQ